MTNCTMKAYSFFLRPLFPYRPTTSQNGGGETPEKPIDLRLGLSKRDVPLQQLDVCLYVQRSQKVMLFSVFYVDISF